MSERLRPSAATVRRAALASLVVLTGIVVTGAAVRLTASGLGCPTWPRCTEGSLVAEEFAGHAAVEFGNRLLSLAVGVVVLGTVAVTARHRPARRDLRLLAGALLLGTLGQGVLGGVTVRTGLSPLTVAAHFLLSMGLLAAAVTLHVRAGEPAAPRRPVVPPALLALTVIVTVVTAGTLVLGTVVTGTGPHSGDPQADRLPFDPQSVSQLHADAVFLLLGLVLAATLALRAAGAPRLVTARADLLLGVLLGQATVGFVQYVTGLPVVLVGLHVLGACLVWVAALRLLVAGWQPAPRPADPPMPAAARLPAAV